ncbi:MAG: IMP dehydrogenase [Candidatus Pacebacteria bacterium]|nr:IMP dehydrogenase [Candidatus Paceibacterota bacterium]
MERVLYTFDDVLIAPARSAIEPSAAVVGSAACRGLFLRVPVLSAAMDRVTDARMAIAVAKAGALGVLHRNCTKEEQAKMVAQVKKAGVLVAAACGPFDMERALLLAKNGADVIIIDCAHGHNMKVLKSAKAIKAKLPKKVKMIVGNIATAEAAADIIKMNFADGLKVGVGPGSICTTRLVSGVGMPQLTAVMDVVKVAKKAGIPVIADGGMKTTGDIAKALAAGASAVMSGNLFAGTIETPGRIVTKNGKKFKEYRGMGSKPVIGGDSGSQRYLTKGRKAVPEGVVGLVPVKGTAEDVVAEIASGVQVAMGYVGAKDIPEFQKKAKFIRVTLASTVEGRPHSLSEVIE